MTQRDLADAVYAHAGIPQAQREAHYQQDCNWSQPGDRVLSKRAARAYRAIYASLSLEERLAL